MLLTPGAMWSAQGLSPSSQFVLWGSITAHCGKRVGSFRCPHQIDERLFVAATSMYDGVYRWCSNSPQPHRRTGFDNRFLKKKNQRSIHLYCSLCLCRWTSTAAENPKPNGNLAPNQLNETIRIFILSTENSKENCFPPGTEPCTGRFCTPALIRKTARVSSGTRLSQGQRCPVGRGRFKHLSTRRTDPGDFPIAQWKRRRLRKPQFNPCRCISRLARPAAGHRRTGPFSA